MAEDISVTFIIPKDCRSENECSEDMQLAFLTCEQHCGGGLRAQWVHESKWTKFEGLTKRDVFVLTEFEGEFYERLQGTKCLLVGPRCLSCCLTEGTPIPSGPEPVYTIAMRGLTITASGLSKTQKEEIKRKVHWMGGIYSTVLTDDTTHLISDTVLSDKYIKSVEKGIPIMAVTWIQAVWEASLQLNISASSSEFLGHRLPPFTNLQVTTSGIPKKDKQLIMKLVNEHGGQFSGAFQSETTDIVVLTKEGVGSEKYKAALEYGKAVVLPSWVKDSAAKGVALPLAKYRVAGASTSSPLAESRLPDMSLNFSRITNVRPPSNFVDETRSADATMLSGKMKFTQDTKKSDTSIDKEIVTAFETFDMNLIKKAGPIFDGFCIWVCGLEGVPRERALGVVSRGGAVRYDAPHPRLTHVLAPRAAAPAARAAAPAVPVLSPLWLLRSVEAGRALDEAQFLIEDKPSTPAKSSARKPRVEPASPMSKRNLALLRRGPLDLPPPMPEVEEPQDELVNHYLSQQIEPEREKTPEPVHQETAPPVALVCQPDITDDVAEDPTEEIEQIFRGIKIEVQGLDEEALCELGAEVSAAGGVLAGPGAGAMYVLVPLDFELHELVTKDAEAVTVFWIKDCLSQQELVPIQYYHRPVRVPSWAGAGPLAGVVASLSTYSGVERAFLDELAKLLGATTQLRFCRRNTANALASTHLICPTPTGDKYLGALKWGLPAVRGEWLLDCAREGTRVSEREYLVGDTKAPPSPQPEVVEEEQQPLEPEPVPEPEQMEVQVTVTDKENAMLPPLAPAIPRRGSIPSRDQTPNRKDGDEMSPASRYIAMARQGLLGCDSQETPKRVADLKDDARQGGECGVRTPPLEDALSTPNLAALSPTTRRRLQAVRRGEMPSDPIRTPTDPFEKNAQTPDSAFGAALRPGSGRMSPEARKRLWKFVDGLPSKQTEPAPRDKHTPLSEIRNRFLAQFNGDAPTPPSEHPTVAPRKLQLQEQCETPPAKMAKLTQDQSPGGIVSASTMSVAPPPAAAPSPLPAAVDAQLQRLSAALTGRHSSQRPRRHRDSTPTVPAPLPDSEPAPESQPNTVGWDDTTPAQQAEPELQAAPVKRFMLSSNVDNREEIIAMITHLGGEVCEGAELDPEASHLLCAAPGRSEKMLGSVAAGRWVLHPVYVAKSRAAGLFLPEEEYEWGNPLATCLPPLSGAERTLSRAAHRWRSARAAGRAGPFAGVVALLHVPPPRRRLLARLVTAGDGQAPDDEPPYTNENITVCFADIKRYPLSDRDSAWLISKRIPVCAPVLLSSYLTDDPPPKPEDHCLPDFRP
ncbi:DNA topoisomerase 2-binding protein 1 [Spodoptera litura]|uniref:DNA topoisomerase 2-binding protein 1 n=1 Tax=Spodoptera litura TaxID=69820 RepID=A0A9J7E0D8_SPOLT|nr:DNA topoisomerase 2-binding protein 1 [Spodoptera litura]